MVRTGAQRLGSDRKGMEWNHFQRELFGKERVSDAIRGKA